jgi:hypothetical protein
VCLDAGKTACRHETTTEIKRQNRQNGAKNFEEDQIRKLTRVFPQAVKPVHKSSKKCAGFSPEGMVFQAAPLPTTRTRKITP